jgi:hypothetical protein
MEIRLNGFETIMIVVGSLLGGFTLYGTLNDDLANGYIYFGLIMFAVGILIMKKRTKH